MMPRQGTNQSRKIQEVEQALRMAASGRKTSFSIATNQAVAISPIGSASCGVAQVEITPGERIAMAGYSLARKVATDTRSPHFARALYVEDSVGNRAALCFLDLWSASRYLLYKTASMTSTGSSGIDHANLILAGTHTHAGPGRYFGNTLYDAIVQSQSGFYPPVADRLAELIGQCVNQAATSAVPARLGVWNFYSVGVSRNRSYPAFLENPEAASWNIEGPGQGAPTGLPDLSHYAIDPRIICLAAGSADTDELLGAFATFSCHATALGMDNDMYDPDWPRVASSVATQELATQSTNRPCVALSDSAGGDITPMQCDGKHGLALLQQVGEGVGCTIAEAAKCAIKNTADFRVDIRFTEFSPSPESGDFGCLEKITKHRRPWAIGAPTLGGATDGESILHAVVGDSMVGNLFDHRDSQFPKALGLGPIQDTLRDWFRLAPADVLPLHTLKIAGHQFVTIPREPTITTADRIEKAVKALTGVPSASIIGYAGDYSIVHLERELDFTLVILTVACRRDFSEVTRVEKIE
jgi:Neutral/alkaline non-lysosomal ceramidase, N-terminal